MRKILLQPSPELISGFFANAAWLAAFRMSQGTSLKPDEIRVAVDALITLESAIHRLHIGHGNSLESMLDPSVHTA
jgi:hypothetical protein